MKLFIECTFNEEHRKVEKLGDKLAKINKIIDWNAFKRSFVRITHSERMSVYAHSFENQRFS